MRGRSLAVWSLSALSCVGFASAASAASHPQERHDFWIGLGGGVGSASATCDGCDGGNRQPSSGLFLKGGVGFSFLETDVVEGSTTITLDLGTGVGLLAGVG